MPINLCAVERVTTAPGAQEGRGYQPRVAAYAATAPFECQNPLLVCESGALREGHGSDSAHKAREGYGRAGRDVNVPLRSSGLTATDNVVRVAALSRTSNLYGTARL